MISRNVIRSFSVASTASNAALQSSPLISTVEEKMSLLPNGLTVSSVDLQVQNFFLYV